MKKALLCAIWLLSAGCLPAFAQDNAKAVYRDPSAKIQARVSDLIKRMTVEEKVAQLESAWTMPSVAGFSFPSVFSKGQINEAMARKIAANGLGTYAFLDEFVSSPE